MNILCARLNAMECTQFPSADWIASWERNIMNALQVVNVCQILCICHHYELHHSLRISVAKARYKNWMGRITFIQFCPRLTQAIKWIVWKMKEKNKKTWKKTELRWRNDRYTGRRATKRERNSEEKLSFFTPFILFCVLALILSPLYPI